MNASKMPSYYLDSFWMWQKRDGFYHGWAIKLFDDHLLAVRYLHSNYWLYALQVDRAYSPVRVRNWLRVGASASDAAVEFHPEEIVIYRNVVEALERLEAMVSIPTEIDAWFTVVHPCTAPQPEEWEPSGIEDLAERHRLEQYGI